MYINGRVSVNVCLGDYLSLLHQRALSSLSVQLSRHYRESSFGLRITMPSLRFIALAGLAVLSNVASAATDVKLLKGVCSNLPNAVRLPSGQLEAPDVLIQPVRYETCAPSVTGSPPSIGSCCSCR